MRLEIRAFGLDLLSIEITTEVEVAGDVDVDVDGGYLTSMPLGFVANHERPEESGLPYREGWE